MTKVKVLALFSGGLDSILACKLMEQQGIEVEALHFVSSFFGRRKDRESYPEEAWRHYGIRLSVIDVGESFIEVLKDPLHGYGRCFNPCVDCKILLLTRAKRELASRGASFLVSGEVLGQRPMSQRRDTLRIVERDALVTGLLLRPLSALKLPPTRLEEEGLVDRTRLLGISGRGRKEQMTLARELGIHDYPAPAGGCVLTDPALSRRIKNLFGAIPVITENACLLMQVGRHFLLPGKSWLVVGRNEAENKEIKGLSQPGDLLLDIIGGAGPTGLVCGASSFSEHSLAAGIVAGYSRLKGEPEVQVSIRGDGCETIKATPAPPDALHLYRL